MKSIVILAVIIGLGHVLSMKMNAEDFAGIDYLPATEAFTKIKAV